METSGAIDGSLDGSYSYKPLTPLYFIFMVIWAFSAIAWTFNTCKNGHFQQPNKLQWMLAFVPWIKALQLSLSFLFWYSYFYSDLCSLWISFGVYIMGIIFQTSAFVSFFLISHGYCITCHRLSLSERRTMAAQASIFYMTLVGYRASVPYFSVLLVLNYCIIFYVIFNHISRNLTVLRDQLSFIEDEDVHAMHDAVYTKYIMFKKFQGAMHIVAVSELAVFISMDNSLESYWIRLLIREWAQFFIFLYIGWIFRCQKLAPRFSLMPTLSSKRETAVPPIYSIEMDAKTFKEFRSHEWHIGVPTLPHKGSIKDSVVVVIRQPHAYSLSINC
ncbi:hypothetical protein PHJA_001187400 [Phtheirospermum japonicum]|uniref:Uncharacterized protein n=1 Tax=Phtheirospermum japonicum TaxID=374723 RepID=A0A830C520_9LAMI|nr:hypothetical protein PHJA_001187400 [Phtheirospermum japonicum]